jgi:tellurite methyltransferase
MNEKINKQFGEIDIYLFDQLLKGRFDDCKFVLDAGCGYGRNLPYFLQNGFEVFGIDESANAIDAVKQIATTLSPNHSTKNFQVGKIETMPFPKFFFDIVICSAVLHFARDHKQFDAMLRACFHCLKPGGYFFARLASSIGIEQLVTNLGNGRFLLPDGSERFLVDQKLLLDYTSNLDGVLFEPIKTTNVQNMRCMTTWCVQKKK